MDLSHFANLTGPELQAAVNALTDEEADQLRDWVEWRQWPEKARKSHLEFCQFTMPDPEHFQSPRHSKYSVAPHNRLMSEAIEKVFSGECLRLALSIPPQHSKSETLTRRGTTYHIGKFPWKNLIIGTYNQDFANEFGDDVRNILESREFGMVFPRVKLRTGSKAKDHMVTEDGGKISFMGRKGSGTGRPADGFLIDDPIKNAMEAESKTVRDEVWDFYTRVANTRCHALSWQIIIQCMTGDTPVLLPDGTERRLDEIRPGDKVATYSDGRLSTSTVRAWRSNGRDSIFKIKTSAGRTVRANGRHPFLVVGGDGELKWVRTANLNTAHRIVAVPSGEFGMARIASSMRAGSQPSAGATACLITSRKSGPMDQGLHRTTLRPDASAISSTDTELPRKNTIAYLQSRAASALSAALENLLRIGEMACALTIATKRAAFAGSYATPATSRSDTPGVSATLSPWSNTSDFTTDRVTNVEPDGEAEVFDVQIDRTENFIANGLVSHNTRWSEDDLIGRLTDPKNPYYNADVAAQWTVINIPAILDDEAIAKALGKRVGEALWPERFPLSLLETARKMDPYGFSALYMGKPTPPEGAFYKQHHLQTYDSFQQLPKRFRSYLTADLAVSPEKNADKSAAGIWMLDEDDVLWLHPELYWDRKSSDESVEKLIELGSRFKVSDCWMEKGQMDKAIGPFFEKRHMELVRLGKAKSPEGVQYKPQYFNIQRLPVAGSKGLRSVSIRGRMAQGKVRFPSFAPWWSSAKEQLLKFTGSGDDKEDDFCDMIALIGQALDDQVPVSREAANQEEYKFRPTVAWMRGNHVANLRAKKMRANLRGF